MTMHKTLAFLSLISTAWSQTSQSGSGTTTRYWDCCKPSCAWPGKGQSAGVVQTCDANDKPLSDANVQSACAGGSAFMCSSQSPWAVSADLAYGFAAVTASAPNCCQCYQLTFTSGPISGKKMIVQATNTGSDVGGAQFDLAIPGGGFGLYDACTTEWDATTAVWGQQYGGSSTNTCPQFPSALQPGCGFRWDWMQGADNPNVDYETIACPAELVAKSGCGTSGGSTAAATASKPPIESGDDDAADANDSTTTNPQNTTPDTGSTIPVVDQEKAQKGSSSKGGAKAKAGDTKEKTPVAKGASPPSSSSSSSVAPGGTSPPTANAKGAKGAYGRHRYHRRPAKKHGKAKAKAETKAKASAKEGEDCEEKKKTS